MSGEIFRLQELYRTGRADPREVVAEQLERARTSAGAETAFSALFAVTATAEAEAAAVRIARGAPRSVLDGVPVTVEDLLPAGDERASDDGPAEAEIVRRLRALGAVILGSTRLPPYGVRGAAVDNPWAAEPTGRVGGAAATVAMGIGFASLGIDACGSLRNQAAWCGTVGLKPTQGVLSTEGAVPLVPTLDHIALLSRRVDDAGAVVAALSGASRRAARPRPAPLRIGVVLPEATCPDVRWRCQEVLALLAREEAEIVPIEGLPLGAAAAAAITLLYAEAVEMHQTRLAPKWQVYGPAVRRRVLVGAAVGAADYVRARAVRAALRATWPGLLGDVGVDLVATPTVPSGAPPEGWFPLGAADLAAAVLSTSPFDLMGVPAVTVPIGSDATGLPVGLQIAGIAGQDERVLTAAARVEAVRGSWPAPPAFVDPLARLVSAR